MEELSKLVSNINIDKKPTVGVFYHNDMLLHKSTRPHPENPDRLTSILNRLEKENLFSDCKLYTSFGEIERDLLVDFHGEDYVEYVESLWEGESKKDVRFYKDTYYNKHSNYVGSLAANAIKLAVDEVITGKIDRAFGIVRPPGHHAAATHNRIGGFCIYNNVAVAAKYAMKKYGLKRIMIYDWDVHHGDGAHLLDEDRSILYISLHRYDEGVFYPGKSGDMKNLGKGEGEGYNLNYPWNLPHPHYTIGDDEYIYALERVFLPIIKDFNPELIFISAGFDASRGDPLGGLDLTPDGYAYMTKRLMDLAPSRTIIGLEGGYSLESLAIGSEACLRILLGQEMPIKLSDNGLDFETMKKRCCPNAVGTRTAVEAIETFRKYWPILNTSEEALQFESNVKSNIAAKQENDLVEGNSHYLTKQEKFVKKAKSAEQVKLYEELTNEKAKKVSLKINDDLRPFIPKLLGTANIGKEVYLITENLLHLHPLASVVQIKFEKSGRFQKAPLDHFAKNEQGIHDTLTALGFYVSKLIIRDKKGEIALENSQFKHNYDVSTSNITQLFASFIQSSTDTELSADALSYFKEFISNLTKSVEDSRIIWYNPSIMLVLDSAKKFFIASWISFDSAVKETMSQDSNTFVIGLKNFSKILDDIKLSN